MRLAEDNSNWKASNILRKLKVIPDKVIFHAKKNKKLYCRGKFGIKHDMDIVRIERSNLFLRESMFIDWRCKRCGKKDYAHEDRYAKS